MPVKCSESQLQHISSMARVMWVRPYLASAGQETINGCMDWSMHCASCLGREQSSPVTAVGQGAPEVRIITEGVLLMPTFLHRRRKTCIFTDLGFLGSEETLGWCRTRRVKVPVYNMKDISISNTPGYLGTWYR
jgi:hypothetical protein